MRPCLDIGPYIWTAPCFWCAIAAGLGGGGDDTHPAAAPRPGESISLAHPRGTGVCVLSPKPGGQRGGDRGEVMGSPCSGALQPLLCQRGGGHGLGCRNHPPQHILQLPACTATEAACPQAPPLLHCMLGAVVPAPHRPPPMVPMHPDTFDTPHSPGGMGWARTHQHPPRWLPLAGHRHPQPHVLDDVLVRLTWPRKTQREKGGEPPPPEAGEAGGGATGWFWGARGAHALFSSMSSLWQSLVEAERGQA